MFEKLETLTEKLTNFTEKLDEIEENEKNALELIGTFLFYFI